MDTSLAKCVHIDKEIVIFGAGALGMLVLDFFLLNRKRPVLIIDNNKDIYGKKKKGIKICSPAEGKEKYPKAIFVIANANHEKNMKKQLLKLGICENSIVVCNNECLLKQEILKKSVVKYEDKLFIYDTPCEKSMKSKCDLVKAKLKAFAYSAFMDHYYPEKKSKKKFDVSICAIFKNESVYLKEWIEYHKIIGIQHFYMYNNHSSDDFQSIIRPYIDSGEITLIDWPYEQGQMSAYRDCIKKFKKESQWIGFIDIDEFIVPIDYDNLYDFLKKYEKNRGSVLIYWKLFGSSGKIDRDTSRLVTEDFILCWRKHTNIGKCFFNTSYDFIPDYSKNDMIHHKMWTGYRGKALPPINCFGKVCIDGLNIGQGDHFPIQINHYFTKSVAEYDNKKRKGDVYHKKNPHDDTYFMKHDMKCGAVDVNIYKYMIRLKDHYYNKMDKGENHGE
ncbi:MAG: glycosyltransferase family 92 protein [Lachnospiraceae bacterium]|nr:glycosyltransferase family 92 protein [Lachnospiraceae bacterium]